MLLAWMAYATLVAALMLGAASVVESRMRSRTRWGWATVLLLGGAVPVARPVLARWGGGGGVSVVLGPMAPAVEAALGGLDAVAASPVAGRLQVPVAALWAGASGAAALMVLGGMVRVAWRRRRWRRAVVDGVSVLVADADGPAVVGVRRPEIVLPRWALSLPPGERRLVLVHEAEHRRRGDPALLAAALAVPVLLPWSPALWLAFFRLRHAVEADCDARVLARGAGTPAGYARLLLHVGAMPARSIPLGAGFGERASSLERRIRALLTERTRGGWRSAAARAALALAIVAAACSLEVNVNLAAREEGPAGAVSGPPAPAGASETGLGTDEIVIPPGPAEGRIRPAGEQVADGPTFTPFTRAPRILNRAEVVRAMEAEYPPLLREAGVSGTVKVYFLIDETGAVRKTLVDQGSGHAALDAAALRVAGIYRFDPARNREEPVPVWVSFPITFVVRR